MEDVIGNESGDNSMASNAEDLEAEVESAASRCNNHTAKLPKHRRGMTKEFPPVIPLLAQQTDQICFKREIIDGRLILTAETVKRRRYLEAHRENGRLVMKPVPPPDDVVYCEDCGHEILEDEEEQLQLPDSLMQKSPIENETEQGEDLRKCLTTTPFWKGQQGIQGADGCSFGPGSGNFRPTTVI